MSKKDSKKAEPAGSDTVDFTIDPESVKDEYVRIPAYIATLNTVYAQALKIAILAKHRRDKVYAELYNEIVSDADKKPAEATIKQMVMLDDRYTDAVTQYAEAEYKKELAWGRAQAMIAKKDMVVSLGAHVRQELGGSGQGGLDEDRLNEDDDED